MKKSMWSVGLVCVLAIGLVVSLSLPAQAKTEWKMALGDAAGGTQWEVGTAFAKLLEKHSNGEVTAALFPNGQLGSEQETVQNCRLGTLDLSVIAINNVTPYSPKVGLLTLPYMILSLEEAVELTQGPIWAEINRANHQSRRCPYFGLGLFGFQGSDQLQATGKNCGGS